MSKSLAVDARYGAAGDMFLGALVSLGADLSVAQDAIDRVYPALVRLESQTVDRAGISAIKVSVIELEESHHSRMWSDIESAILNSDLEPRVKEFSYKIFELLAQAEADAHQLPLSEVHFHEVGAADSIADIVGTAALLHQLDVRKILCDFLEVGSGTIESQHGTLNVPAPATKRLLAGARYSAELKGEALTPTGAAIIMALGEIRSKLKYSSKQGRGAGSRNPAEYPNLLRVSILDDMSDEEQSQLESNIDDIDPRLIPVAIEKLMAAGALDAWVEPIMMKKNRPGFTLKVLCKKDDEKKLGKVIFEETSSIGYRTLTVGKIALDRFFVKIALRGEAISVKVSVCDGVIMQVSPEFDEIHALATAIAIPTRVLMEEARSVAREQGLIFGAEFSG